jgi:hypothetical protein
MAKQLGGFVINKPFNGSWWNLPEGNMGIFF